MNSNKSISKYKKKIIIEQDSISYKSSSDDSDTIYNNIPNL